MDLNKDRRSKGGFCPCFLKGKKIKLINRKRKIIDYTTENGNLSREVIYQESPEQLMFVHFVHY